MADFVLKRGDRRPPLQATLKDAAGAVVNLTGATVKLLMRSPTGSAAKVNAAATIANAAGGQVSYAWAAADTDTAGRFRAEFEVVHADGLRETFPSPGYIEIEIVEDLG